MSGPGPFPLRVPSDEVAATLNGVLDRAAFTEAAICERLGVSTLDSIEERAFKARAGRLSGGDLLDALTRLFVFGGVVDAASLEAHLRPGELEAFLCSDLVRAYDRDGSPSRRVFSPVRLVPVDTGVAASGSLVLAGDRADHPDGSRFTPFPDIVFSGHNPLTRRFLKLLPETPCEAVLDLCTGTGVAALAQRPVARSCTAVDIAERSVHFARFNAGLNRAPALDVLCGDLYGPLAGRQFDRIVAHPPYVPALRRELTYRDAGEAGDEVVREVVRGVPAHLTEGGTFHLLCLATDTADGSFEQRVRQWLGEAEGEFDLVFALASMTTAEAIAIRLIERAGGSPDELVEWRHLFERLRVKEFVYGALAGRRFGPRASREAFTRRVLLTEESTGAAFDWLFRWFDWFGRPDRDARVLTATPRLAPDVRLDVTHGVQAGTFEPVRYTLANGGRPFYAQIETDAWVAVLLPEFDGARTTREVFAGAAARGRVPSPFGEADVVRLTGFLLERGCLLLGRDGDDHAVPHAAGLP